MGSARELSILRGLLPRDRCLEVRSRARRGCARHGSSQYARSGRRAMTLSARQWERIHANQARELDILVSDPESARRLALSASYGRVGAWLRGPGRRQGARTRMRAGPEFVALLAQLGCRVVGVDPYGAEALPDWARLGRRCRRRRLRGGVRAESLPFEERNTFDHAACMGALLYFDDPVGALNELHRVVKPGGRLVLRTVNRENLFTALTGRRLDPASKNLYSSRRNCPHSSMHKVTGCRRYLHLRFLATRLYPLLVVSRQHRRQAPRCSGPSRR